jgi:hypothetical protein
MPVFAEACARSGSEKILYCFHQNNDHSKCEVAHPFLPIRPSKSSVLEPEGNMAPKPKSKPARFVFAVAMALTILAVMTWEMAAPSSPIYPIYQPQLLLLD